MNEDQTAAMLASLGAAFPAFEPSRATVTTWTGALRSVRVEDAREACEKLIRTCRFFPSIAEFFNEETAARRARESRESAERGLPGVSGTIPPPERLAKLLSQLREELGDSGARDHWHGGPNPCPKCGGTKSTLVTGSRRWKSRAAV